MILACQGTYGERINQTLEGIKRLRRCVDKMIIICDETVTTEQIHQLTDSGCEVFVHPWEDNFPNMRNHYLGQAKDGDWIIVSDPDEWFGADFIKDLRGIVDELTRSNIDLALINSHDIWHKNDGSVESELKSSFYKNLIFRFKTGMKYVGVGEAANVHEQLIFPNGSPKTVQLADKYFYEHHKFLWEVWERAMRNVYIGGGGNNRGKTNPKWEPLRRICDKLGLKLWKDVREYMRKGNINPSLKQWIIDNRRDGKDYEHEMMEGGFRWYFEYLHPEEKPEGMNTLPCIEDKITSAEKIVEELYMKILGRHADQEGKEQYAALLVEGKKSPEDIAKILQGSEEAARPKQQGGKSTDNYNVALLSVLAGIGDILDDMRNTMKKEVPVIAADNTFLEKWQRMMRIPMKVESNGAGNDDSASEGFVPLIKTFTQYAPPAQYKKVLNLGAGAGPETKLLKESGYEPLGITFGKDNIKMGKEKYGVELVEMDMHDLHLPDKSFDACFSVQVMEHAFSPWMVVLELRRVLRDGGIVFMDIPDAADESMNKTIWHTSVLFPKQWIYLFEKAGFKLVEDISVKHRGGLVFEKLPDGTFEMWSYIQHVVK